MKTLLESQNTAAGKSSLRNNTIGESNTAYGFHSLEEANTEGKYNTAQMGITPFQIILQPIMALQSEQKPYKLIHKGLGNTAVGTNALESNTTGSSNTVSGWNSMPANTTGSSNVAMGVNSMSANTTGGLIPQ